MKRLLTVLVFAFFCLTGFSQGLSGLVYGPWIQNVDEEGFTVIYKTATPNLSWIEVAPDDGSSFYNQVRPRFWETSGGRRMSSTLHRIRVDGLQKGQRYRYVIFGREVVNDDDPYGTVYGREGRLLWESSVSTLDGDAATCTFSQVNDIHEDEARYKRLTESLEPASLDFFVMNGDMVSYITSIDTMMRYTFRPVASLVRNVPTVYARGNHETRGREFYLLPSVLDTPTGEYYYTFRQGPVAFLVLDGGEDKPDSSPEYSGTADYVAYHEKELSWLKEAVKDKDFQDAPFKVVLCHIPTITVDSPWFTQQWMCDHMLPLLNEAGVDLMISGHHHQHIYVESGTCGNAFPILVNSNLERLDFKADASRIEVGTFDTSGVRQHRYVFEKK